MDLLAYARKLITDRGFVADGPYPDTDWQVLRINVRNTGDTAGSVQIPNKFLLDDADEDYVRSRIESKVRDAFSQLPKEPILKQPRNAPHVRLQP